MYEWLNPAHGKLSIILHVLGYAALMTAIFVVVHFAVVGRNMLAKRMRSKRNGNIMEKEAMLEDYSSYGESNEAVDVQRPKQAQRSVGDREWV